MLSTIIPTSEKKTKSSKPSKSSKKSSSSSKYDDASLLGEPVKATKKKSKSALKKLKDQSTEDKTPDDITEEGQSKLDDATQQVQDKLDNDEGITDKINDTTEQANEEVSDKVEQVSDQAQGLNADEADQLIEQARNKVAAIVGNNNASDDDENEEQEGDADALTTMNAILEYNRTLVQKFQEFEQRMGGFNKQDVQGAINDTLNEVSAKYNKDSDSKGVHHSFELPIGDMMKGYGSLSTTSLPNDNSAAKEQEEKKQQHEDDQSTVKDDDDAGKIRIGDGEKDDIVVKVEATKTGITFAIHIPRS